MIETNLLQACKEMSKVVPTWLDSSRIDYGFIVAQLCVPQRHPKSHAVIVIYAIWWGRSHGP